MEDKVFYKGRPLSCRKNFRFAGKDYAIGDNFPYDKLAVSPKKAQQLLDANFLTHQDMGYAAPKKPIADSDEGIEREDLDKMGIDELYHFCAENEIDLNVEEFDDLDELRDEIWDSLEEEDPDVPNLVHRGGGWYDVMIGDEKQNEGSLKKDAAEKLIKKLLKG